LLGMFDFSKGTPQNTARLILDPDTGLVRDQK
jgi:hypothetical protein